MHILLDKYFSPIEKYNVLQNINLQQVKNFIAKYLASLHIRCLVQGNVSEEIAKETVKTFAELLNCSPLTKEVYPRVRNFFYFK